MIIHTHTLGVYINTHLALHKHLSFFVYFPSGMRKTTTVNDMSQDRGARWQKVRSGQYIPLAHGIRSGHWQLSRPSDRGRAELRIHSRGSQQRWLETLEPRKDQILKAANNDALNPCTSPSKIPDHPALRTSPQRNESPLLHYLAPAVKEATVEQQFALSILDRVRRRLHVCLARGNNERQAHTNRMFWRRTLT